MNDTCNYIFKRLDNCEKVIKHNAKVVNRHAFIILVTAGFLALTVKKVMNLEEEINILKEQKGE